MSGKMIVCVLSLITGIVPCSAQIYVNKNATGANTGTNWANAYVDLQSALAAAGTGDVVWVATGVYFPGASSTSTFTLPDAVRILGGFIGNETSETQRNPTANVTVLSGELATPGVADNIEVIVTAAAIGSNTELDGFHIVGAANHGIQVTAASPQLLNLRVTDCGQELDGCGFPLFGGGMNIVSVGTQPVVVTDCEFARNSAGFGGALSMDSSALAEFLRCTFSDNSSVAVSSGGGAAVISDHSNATFKVCSFVNNQSVGANGGAMILKANPVVKIAHCAFVGNRAALGAEGAGANGGAIAADGNEDPNNAGLVIHDCVFQANRAEGNGLSIGLGGAFYMVKGVNIDVANCLFFDNEAQSKAGAIFSFGNRETNTNCTIADCSAPQAGGAYVANIPDHGEFSTWRNVVIWNCIHSGANDETKSIDIDVNATNVLLDHCCIDDGAPLDSHVAYNYPTVIDVDPRFANETERAFQLRIDSPCVDAGNTPPVPTDALDADLDLITPEKSPDQQFIRRVFDDPAATNTGVINDNPYTGECGYVDMGAFERQTYCTSGVQGDFDDNGLVNGLDIQPFVLCFLHGSPATLPCSCSDINMDGGYTLDDVTCLIDILLMRKWCEVSNDCPVPHEGGEGEGGEGGGEGRQMMMQSPGGADNAAEAAAGLGKKSDAENSSDVGVADPASPPEVEPEDPAFTARWNAFVEWLETHWIDQYPDMTEEEWNSWTMSVEIDMVYEGVAPH